MGPCNKSRYKWLPSNLSIRSITVALNSNSINDDEHTYSCCKYTDQNGLILPSTNDHASYPSLDEESQVFPTRPNELIVPNGPFWLVLATLS